MPNSTSNLEGVQTLLRICLKGLEIVQTKLWHG